MGGQFKENLDCNIKGGGRKGEQKKRHVKQTIGTKGKKVTMKTKRKRKSYLKNIQCYFKGNIKS